MRDSVPTFRRPLLLPWLARAFKGNLGQRERCINEPAMNIYSTFMADEEGANSASWNADLAKQFEIYRDYLET